MEATEFKAKGKKILILTADIYGTIGGGEQVYRTLIADNPEIEFFFFESFKTPAGSLPQNAHTIPLRPKPELNRNQRKRYENNSRQKASKIFSEYHKNAAERAEQYAQSASGYTFDLIDVPEYEIVGNYLRESLRRNEVKFQILTSFIHGSLSRTLEFEGNISRADLTELKSIEKSQRDEADLFFILDSWYPDQLGIPGTSCIQLDPWLFVKQTGAIRLEEKSENHTRLAFFARWERRKGVDLLPRLATLVSSIDKTLMLFGDSLKNPKLRNEVISSAEKRDLTLLDLKSTDSDFAYGNISQNDILVIPSRFDSFNLVSLEAIAKGKCVAISKMCGVVHFLNERHPDINYIEIDPNDIVESSQRITEALETKLIISSGVKQNIGICSQIFTSLKRDQFTSLIDDLSNFKEKSDKYSIHNLVFNSPSVKRRLISALKKSNLSFFAAKAKTVKNRLMSFYSKRYQLFAPYYLIFLYLQSLPSLGHLILYFDREKKNIFSKPKYFLDLSDTKDTSTLKKLTYGIRSLRFAGYETKKINAVNLISDLRLNGLIEESLALQLAVNDLSGEKIYFYLEDRRLKLIQEPKFTFEHEQVIESLAVKRQPKVSIIVSSFNGAPKLRVFLKRLSLCQELLDGTAEILLIDANSNSSDADIAVRIANEFGIALRAIRVKRRITIQEAWNFGIIQSSGEYLSFLGVDETIFPMALRSLYEKLDSDHSVDWVMGNSIVTEVGEDGEYARDIMSYDRNGAGFVLPFLETCYVSYVGGMYRKNIHEKYGYYDPTFTGAGDTEFKSRVLPSLKVAYIDAVLGEFLNYPEERTTASERIELEDIRAWYIFRTVGGLMYQHSLAGDDYLENLGWNSLGYRKSYCKHKSTDLEIASTIYRIAKNGKYGVSNDLLMKLKNADQQIQTMRNFLGFGSKEGRPLSFKRFFLLAQWFDIEGRKSATKGARRMKLDNMFEQHIWYW